jgi:hypothetical protein
MLSASGSARWLACPPSAKLETRFPNTSSSYADEGTAAHELCELAARYWLGEISEKSYENKRNKLSKGQYYSAEMQERAIDYARFIRHKITTIRADCPDAIIEFEVTDLDYSQWAPDGRGTGDCIIVTDGLLEIIDFKYGKGYRVNAEGNTQMRLYALGTIARYGELYELDRIRMTITQPRISAEPSTDEISVVELLDWAENYVKPRAALAYAGQGDFSPSAETCKFCRAKEQCKARAEQNLSLFEDSPDVLLITPGEAAEIFGKASDIRAWLSDLENLLVKTLFAGEPVEGWKLVEGRSNRKYSDELLVAEALKAAGYDEASIYERKLIALTAMEKALGKKVVAETLDGLIVKPQGKPTLAPEKDRRPAFTPEQLVLDAFDDGE